MNTQEPTLCKCRCNNCDAKLEFDVSQAGDAVACPTCGMETVLYLARPAAPKPREPIDWRFWSVMAGLVVLVAGIGALLAVVVKYCGPVIRNIGSNITGEQIGGFISGVIALFIGLLLFYLALMWVLLPVIVWYYLSRIERNTRLRP